MASKLEYCEICAEEIMEPDGRVLCYTCDLDQQTGSWGSHTEDQPIWYTLSEVIEQTNMPQRPWQDLMELAQMLHDLRIDDPGKLMRRLGAVYVEDPEKKLYGEYYYAKDEYDSDRFLREIGPGYKTTKKEAAKEPIWSNRRQAIMAQRAKKNEGS